MILDFFHNRSLKAKFIFCIGLIISISYTIILIKISTIEDELIISQAKHQARMLHRQVVLTRQWVANHSGVFVKQNIDNQPNPYLDMPTIIDQHGNSYVMRNPAMVTKELSDLSGNSGLGYYRVTSLKPVNPSNKPTAEEKKCLIDFAHGKRESMEIAYGPDGKEIRYMAPLVVDDSCLACHARHGYVPGDIRGALSITIPIGWTDFLKSEHNRSLSLIGAVSIFLVTLTMFYMIDNLILQRIRTLSSAMDSFPKTSPIRPVLTKGSDELNALSNEFFNLCKRLEESQQELDQSKVQAAFNEKMASLGILSAGIAHEINNPLGGMLNCTKVMLEDPSNTAQNKRYLPLFNKGLNQICNITRQLLNFGRTGPATKTLANIEDVINECIELLSYKSKSVEIKLDIGLDEMINIDTEALRQIIINLGLNSFQAMPKGGVFTVKARVKNKQLILQLIDTGTGITPQNQKHIFDPFFTTKDIGEGTGLGLAVTFSLIQRMHGHISLKSSEGKGTSFTITIPV